MITRGLLTRTELETLAVMIHGASRHMQHARTSAGEPVWTAGNPGTAGNYADMYDDMLYVFYELQDLSGQDPVTVHG